MYMLPRIAPEGVEPSPLPSGGSINPLDCGAAITIYDIHLNKLFYEKKITGVRFELTMHEGARYLNNSIVHEPSGNSQASLPRFHYICCTDNNKNVSYNEV